MPVRGVLWFAPFAVLNAQQPGVTALPDTVVTRIDRVFAGTAGISGREAPGCALGLARNGQPVLLRAYGLANLEYGVPNTHQTIFESGSVAKQFTAAAMVLLAQDGKLSLDDDIRRHLPEVPDFGKKITIRNLLTHTSGLRDQWGLLSIKGLGPGTQVHTLNTIVDLVAHQKALNFDPGSEYLYSNTGYALAAIIIQRVSGMPFATFSQERLFKPLGMTSTQWRDDFARVVKNRATAYDGSAPAGFRQDMPFTNVHGNGGLLTTVGDLLKWNAFLDAPGTIDGAAALVQTLTTPMTLTNGKRITYALGLSVTTRDGMRELSHSGSTAGYQTWLARYPDEHVSVAVLCNAGGAANAAAYDVRCQRHAGPTAASHHCRRCERPDGRRRARALCRDVSRIESGVARPDDRPRRTTRLRDPVAQNVDGRGCGSLSSWADGTRLPDDERQGAARVADRGHGYDGVFTNRGVDTDVQGASGVRRQLLERRTRHAPHLRDARFRARREAASRG